MNLNDKLTVERLINGYSLTYVKNNGVYVHHLPSLDKFGLLTKLDGLLDNYDLGPKYYSDCVKVVRLSEYNKLVK